MTLNEKGLEAAATKLDVAGLLDRLARHETHAMGDYYLVGLEDSTVQEAASALTRLAKERDEARAENEVLFGTLTRERLAADAEASRLRKEVEELRAKVERAREVIAPFATAGVEIDRLYPDYADHIRLFYDVTHGDFRASRRFNEEG